ncbi:MULTISPECIES: hypothetical protein [Raoultella]|uniref:hypothetical protein n=1 Tax=Raoultella TaxID=160674 RepID=UPI0007E9F100|nr:hypothetical protein [Raoultella planticola]OAZ77856.1 hypothetical protein AYO04_07800 [Raoultella planticola]OAZ82218.1 hypothetical protein AYO05_18215 [Raoultella planticola]
MIQHKKYLACQAWCTPVANLILVKLGVLVGLSKDFNSFIPGLAVVVAHFFLLLLTLINVPSIEDVRFKVDVAKSQKLLEKMKREAASEKEKTEIDEALATLRSKLIAKSLKDVEHSMSVHSNALQGDTEKP